MLGHQINFFATTKDMKVIEDALREIEPMVVLHNRSSSEKPQVVESMDGDDSGQSWLYFYLARPKDLGNIETDYVPTQGYWIIDTTIAPVVEFHRSFFNGKILRRGRIYFSSSFYGGDEGVLIKPEDFNKWAKKIISVARKNLIKHGSDYIGKEAKELIESSKVHFE